MGKQIIENWLQGCIHVICKSSQEDAQSAGRLGPKLDEKRQPRTYHAALDATLNSFQGDLTERIENSATTSVSKCQHTKKSHNNEVQGRFDQRRRACDPERRKDLSKEFWKLLRRKRRQTLCDILAPAPSFRMSLTTKTANRDKPFMIPKSA